MLIFGAIGMVIVSSLIMGTRDTALMFAIMPIQMVAGFIGMIIYYKISPSFYKNILSKDNAFCCIHGLLTFLIGVITACSVNVLLNVNDGIDIVSYGYKPAYWLVLFGSIPALIVGLFYLLGRRLTSRYTGADNG